jgi:nitrite reductase (NADH) small subunit
MNKWIRVTPAENIPLREGRAIEVAGEKIALFNLGDRFLAVGNACPHQGGPLADGIVSGDTVVCPLHARRICLVSGSMVKPAGGGCVTAYPVKLEEGILSIQIPSAVNLTVSFAHAPDAGN